MQVMGITLTEAEPAPVVRSTRKEGSILLGGGMVATVSHIADAHHLFAVDITIMGRFFVMPLCRVDGCAVDEAEALVRLGDNLRAVHEATGVLLKKLGGEG